jgi:DNA-binding transcriptional ArsR family regulator
LISLFARSTIVSIGTRVAEDGMKPLDFRGKYAMVGKKSSSATSNRMTGDRVERLLRLLRLLDDERPTRDTILKKLKQHLRGFYRDLDALRDAGIEIEQLDGRYELKRPVAEAIERLPFPDPNLTFGEVRHLAKGRTRAHQKLKQQLGAFAK